MVDVRRRRRRLGEPRSRALGAGLAIVLVAALATGTAGCSPTTGAVPAKPVPTASFPVTVTDDASRTVTIEKAPRRLVSLAPANTETLYALGKLGEVVGVTTFDDYPAQVKSIPKMGDFTTPNLEAIAAAKPDVVFVTGGVQADVIDKIEQLGTEVVVVDPKDIAGVYRAIGLMSRVVDAPAKGAAVVAAMKADLADVRERVSADKPVRAFVEIGWNPLYTAGPGTLLDDLLVQAGGENVVKEPGYVGYSVEQLVKDQPDVYLGTKSSIGDPFALESRPGYASLKAVEAGSIFTLDDNVVSRPGPRIVEGVREIAKALHPDAFE